MTSGPAPRLYIYWAKRHIVKENMKARLNSLVDLWP